MNCKQIDELLPLYAGRDLDEKRARLVSEHIQICEACERVADEYRETVELTQHFAAPVFTENAYANVRQEVLRQIEDEPAAPLLPLVFGSWLRPRLTWAAASALIIAFGLFALYLIVNPKAGVQLVADNHPTMIEHPGSSATPPKTTDASSGSAPEPGEDKRRVIRRFVKRSSLLAATARSSSSTAGSILPKSRDPEANSLPPDNAVPDPSPLRLEMQTKDPNIRIIWFTQPNTKPALPNAKGI